MPLKKEAEAEAECVQQSSVLPDGGDALVPQIANPLPILNSQSVELEAEAEPFRIPFGRAPEALLGAFDAAVSFNGWISHLQSSHPIYKVQLMHLCNKSFQPGSMLDSNLQVLMPRLPFQVLPFSPLSRETGVLTSGFYVTVPPVCYSFLEAPGFLIGSAPFR